MTRASMLGTTAVALTAVSSLILACHSEKRSERLPEVDAALDLVAPRSASNVSALTYDRGTHSVSARREFDVGTSWGEYAPWVQNALAPDWKGGVAGDGGAESSALHFGKQVRSDAYLLSIERVSEGPPVHVRATVLVVPD